jgi:hypothetical protein
VERIEEGRVPKQALWYRPNGRRDPGRPCTRWNSQKPEQANGLSLELEKRNSIHPSIKFTTRKEIKINYLDQTITNRKNKLNFGN